MIRTLDKKRLAEAAVWQRKADDAARLLKTETDERRRYLLQLGVDEWGRKAKAHRGLSPSEVRVVTVSATSAGFSSLFLVPPALAGWADVSAPMVAGGIAFPVVVFSLGWTLKNVVARWDARRAGLDSRAGELMVLAAERQEQARVRAVSR
ncbi:hypothetical protein [Actinoplanes sichuanensis]|uniref:Holin of 3TMs, for gene-transfer release n=1 Tax=Actinoplanes sichuanensis TaxID=512349 RepID=A0ABW4A6U4_9ACTN|nr:hypothetical protein [Actinoplanes sichuanensis]